MKKRIIPSFPANNLLLLYKSRSQNNREDRDRYLGQFYRQVNKEEKEKRIAESGGT